MEFLTFLLFFLTALRCTLSFEERDTLSHVNKFSVNEYIRKDGNEDHGKFQATEYFEKIAADFTDDINTAKEALQNMFLDIEASFEELSDDVAKSVSQYSYDTEEKLNILVGLVNEFVENNKGVIFKSSEEKKKVEEHKFKKMCDLILEKVKTVVELSTINNYRIILKFGKGDRKSDILDKVKNDDSISDALKSELLKYEDVESKNANVSSLVNFISPIYESFKQKLNALIREVSSDLGKII
ncbi:sporozoite microneme protein [Plasmodium cynomolgi strain B]|uniref:Sporozoite microneme protein n=1 Tax=Plasmodium cynomolgi (strain B) TaxID=1120755 RepID=K6UVQ8_PLACD|nr:sporozoite microneme protein [Plasmodium cynomolgi strain B]GAB67644.1 sporozoite microneme protein [Plasmodium cynomolgi strain B]